MIKLFFTTLLLVVILINTLLSKVEIFLLNNLIPDRAEKVMQPDRKLVLLEPEDGKVYHGVQLMTYESGNDPIGPYLAALNDSTIQPAVRGFFMSIPGERGPDKSLVGLKNFFHASDSIGFIPELSLFFIGKTATDSAIAVTNQHDRIIDSIITLAKDYGKKMFLRIGGEFNGAGAGWNGGGYHPYLYVTAFRKIVDMFSARGLRDSIAVNWCYEPDAANDFDSVDGRGARWYPGDNYVDWFGLDVFDSSHFDQRLPDFFRGSITKKGKSERFLAMARSKGKPVYMSETSAKAVNISSDNMDGINDWNNWFSKFFEFIDAHKEIKGYGYINANWPTGAYPGWGDARIQNSPFVTAKYIEEMKKSKYIHLPVKITQQEDLPEQVSLISPINNYQLDGQISSALLVWHSSKPNIIKYLVEVASDYEFTGISFADSLSDTTRFISGINHNSYIYWRVKAKNSTGWGPYSDIWRFNKSEFSDIEEKQINNDFQVSPNPVTDFMEISFSIHTLNSMVDDKIEIFSVMGEKLLSCPNTHYSKLNTPSKIDVSSLAPGVYFVKVGERVSKFVKI